MSEIKIDTHKITMPLITDEELMKVDNNLEHIVQEFLQTKIHDKDLLICQHIIEKLQQENQQLKIQVSSREEVANKYKEVIDEVREVINKMIYTGYFLENNNTATQFMATNKNSEFGIRAEVLLQILDKGADN